MLSTNRKIRLLKACRHFARWSLATFCICVPLFIAAAFIGATRNEYLGTLLAIPAAALIFLSAVAYPSAIALRDVLAYGYKPWRFSLFQLLCVFTGASLGMGILFYLLKVLP
jgi:hypothetical protein